MTQPNPIDGIREILNNFAEDVIVNQPDNILDLDKQRDTVVVPLIQKLIDQAVIEARVDELKRFSDQYFNDGLWYYRDRIEDRISELKAELEE